LEVIEGSSLRAQRIKKDPERKPGVSSPDGYSGGKGGAAQLKYTALTSAAGNGSGWYGNNLKFIHKAKIRRQMVMVLKFHRFRARVGSKFGGHHP
jgi:hypothetical protein